MEATFRVQGIDHVEVFVPDRYEAAAWYAEVLGLAICRELEDWAGPGGPLMLSSDGGRTMLALFEGEPLAGREPVGLIRVAFRVDAAGFRQFLDRLDSRAIVDHTGARVTRERVKDHSRAFSVYVCDPWGNRYEVTTYEYAEVQAALAGTARG